MQDNDTLVKTRHYVDALDKAERTNKEPVLHTGDGHVIKGSIFDCDRKTFERALSNYWDRLFVGWNPYKREGRGCWEVWQRPINKTRLSNFEHWVADLEYLDMGFIRRLREMDAWENKQLVEKMDDAGDEYFDKLDKAEEENLKYVIKHNKKLFGDLHEYAKSGYNPFWFLSDKKSKI